MRNSSQQRHRISRMRLAGVRVGMALATVVLVVVTTQSAPAQTFTTLLSFDGTNGANPFAGLVQTTNGDLYGTTSSGGAYCCGTVIKITPSGTLTTLYSFCLQSGCTDGFDPEGALVQAGNGNLYGTTYYGGVNNDGTIFKITPSGTFTELYSLCSQTNCTDGAHAYAGLVQATDGNLYGTTVTGGANNDGTVFRITPSGTFTTLYNFCSKSDCTDGNSSYAGLIQATDGNLYGTTAGGGAKGLGTVFKITLGGTLTTLYSFCQDGGCTDGSDPEGSLIQATNGDFYGTTEYGGANNDGTVFKITPSGTLTTLHSFDGTDGAGPLAPLIQATDGNLYGTTENGGTDGEGTVFKITSATTLTTLHSFDGTDGNQPRGGLVQDTNGSFYGTVAFGGADSFGTLFSLSVGLGPFVETQTASGKVGATVKILGTNLTGSTSVKFNGTAATFTVVSKSEITATVPTGATTGTVEVTVPGGTLKSNTKFRVIP